jgi:hypothetical protein
MLINHYQINTNTLSSGATATTINIPINMEFQLVDQSELVKRVFVNIETEKAINPIIDYDNARYLPLDLQGVYIDKIIYNVDLLGATDYGAIGFTNDDIKFQTEAFKQTFLNLNFYDSDNPLTQILVNNITLYSQLTSDNLLPDSTTQIYEYGYPLGIPGQPKPASMIPLRFILESPLTNPIGFAEGYHIYDYKDELNIGDFKYLYMRATFKNAKLGTTTNTMVRNTAQPIDELVHQLYTRYKLVRNATGYYYEIDDTYQGSSAFTGTNNVTYTYNPIQNSVTVNLYKINAL